MSLPAAVIELLIRYFGDAALPDYSASVGVVSRQPYQPLRDRLAANWHLHDSTDLQYDLGWSWWLDIGTQVVNLRLSFVGPYAVLLDRSGTSTIKSDEVARLVEDEGFAVLTREQLEMPVAVWSPECNGSLYEFLFEFDRGTPWNR
jgi:hypothetical protein